MNTHIIEKFSAFLEVSDINRVLVAHTGRSVALSMIGVYIPILLLKNGQTLNEVILFYVLLHLSGLFCAFLVVVPLMKKIGIIKVFRLYYPLEIGFFILLNIFAVTGQGSLLWIAAVMAGVGSFAYWVPHNILFLRFSKKEYMGQNLAQFFALPKIFAIIGPLIAASVILLFGFVPMFIIASLGLLLSYLPLHGIRSDLVDVQLNFTNVLPKLWQRKKVFTMEVLDNIVEESEWFWGIFAFLIIGTLEAPGIVGALGSIGSALFAVFIGKRIDKSHSYKYVIISSVAMIILWFGRFYIDTPLMAYAVTMLASFTMAMFLVSYFALILKEVKGKDEEEFVVLREIPTVLGRLVVFGGILYFMSSAESARWAFFIPIVAIFGLLCFLYRQKRLERIVAA